MTYEELRKKLNINRRKGENKEEMARLFDMVSEETNREILAKRFIENKKWARIAEDEHYSLKSVYRLASDGLREIVGKLSGELLINEI